MSQNSKSAPVVALFVFVPFCKIKCTYCDFNAYANLMRAVEPYSDALAREIRDWRSDSVGTDERLRAKSIYFGGGTPSLVPVEHINRIIDALSGRFDLEPNTEITLEANPGTVDLERLQALRALGVNRLSLGVQSFDEAMVRRLNRGHTVVDAIETYALARHAGFDNISLDLIYGLPLQTLQEWRATLERAVALSPEHLSLYALKVEQGTGLEHQLRRGVYPVPDDELAADMYELAEDLLDAAGYEHYEISNWARRTDSRSEIGDLPGQSSTSSLRLPISIHNLTYWHDEPYLGFGAGAHSYFEKKRYWNVLPPLTYIERINVGARPVADREEIGRALEMAETVILGLRLIGGIAYSRFAERFGEDLRERYRDALKQVVDLQLVEVRSDRLRLTRRGRLLSNEVFWRFLPD